ncbi:hypothetical protein ACTXG6_00285 [Pseudonocardia sp. Cha107L01]|uniref:hypothetical protein n=1 Tax=Pseudonocardia sp. Cha107L01 TaxID=3457576 RepID=UPI00403EA083
MSTGVDNPGDRRVFETAGAVALVRIAFGDRPEAPIVVHPGDPAEQRWLAAVALGARGRYAAAATLLAGVSGRSGASRTVRAHAAVTRAAHLRQSGGHLAARRWDGLGLALATDPENGGGAAESAIENLATENLATENLATESADSVESTVSGCGAGPVGAGPVGAGPGGAGAGLDLPAARVDALLGLAADAIGLADLELADRLLRLAEPAAAEHPSWRPGVRWHWVRAELALSQNRPEPAIEWARPALARATAAGAVRHQVKSALVLAAAEAGAGSPPERVIAVLSKLSERTRQSGLWTLEWPIQLMLAGLVEPTDLDRSTTHRSRAAQIVWTIRRHSDPFARSVLDRSPWVPTLSETKLLHLDPYHPAETRRSAHSSRMECKNKP